jgi:hypothetical protein
MTIPWNVAGLVNAGVTAELNAAGRKAGCDDLTWTLDASFSSLILSGSAAGMYPDSEVPAVLAGWRDLLGMTLTDPVVAGTRQLIAQFPGLTVSVWGVIDGMKYHAEAGDVFERQLGAGADDGELDDEVVTASAGRLVADDAR